MSDDRKTGIEGMVEELFEDPDSPEKGDRDTPQTIEGESTPAEKDGR